MQYNNGIPADSRYAVHADFFKSRLAQLQSPEGQKEIEKVIVLTELAEKGMIRTIHLNAMLSSRPDRADGHRFRLPARTRMQSAAPCVGVAGR